LFWHLGILHGLPTKGSSFGQPHPSLLNDVQNTTGARRTEVRKQSLIKPAWMPMRKKRTLAIKKMMHLFS
jgi:hypothetical protein